MTPAAFWAVFRNQFIAFIYRLYTLVYMPMVNTILNNPILLLVFGFCILGFVIDIFKRMRC